MSHEEAIGYFLSRNSLRVLAARPRRGQKIVAGGVNPRIGCCIERAPAGAKDLYPQPFSVAPPGLRVDFWPDPGLAPGAIIFLPLRGAPAGRTSFATETRLGFLLITRHSTGIRSTMPSIKIFDSSLITHYLSLSSGRWCLFGRGGRARAWFAGLRDWIVPPTPFVQTAWQGPAGCSFR
jgi:hypothetical protein